MQTNADTALVSKHPEDPVSKITVNVCIGGLESGSESGSYSSLLDSCITQLKAQGPCRTRNESTEEEKKHCRPRVEDHSERLRTGAPRP